MATAGTLVTAAGEMSGGLRGKHHIHVMETRQSTALARSWADTATPKKGEESPRGHAKEKPRGRSPATPNYLKA